MRRFVLVLIALALAACGPSDKDMQELQNNQKQILAKLRDLEKKIESSAPARPRRARAQPDPNKVYEIPVGKSPIRGPKDAPVTIVEFSDYQCPFCGRAEPLVESILASYPKQARLVFKNFPLVSIHPYAMSASEAAVAAGLQGKYWEMHDLLFKNQRALTPADLEKYAAEIGLDVEKWKKDRSSPEVQAMIRDDMRAASSAEVRGTPTFFVDGKRLEARSDAGFKAMIETALKKEKTG